MSIFLDYLSDRVPKNCIRAILAIDEYELTPARLMSAIRWERGLTANQCNAIDEIMSVAVVLNQEDQCNLMIALLAPMPGFDEYFELSLSGRQYQKAIFLGKYLHEEFRVSGMRNIRQSVQRWYDIPDWKGNGVMKLPYQPTNFAEFSTMIYLYETTNDRVDQVLQRALTLRVSASNKLVEAFHIDQSMDKTPKWLGENLNYPDTGLMVPPPTYATMVSTRNREIMYRDYRDRQNNRG